MPESIRTVEVSWDTPPELVVKRLSELLLREDALKAKWSDTDDGADLAGPTKGKKKRSK